MTLTVTDAIRTDVGHLRERNEDRAIVCHGPDEATGVLLCVADGMGGHPAGDEAAQQIVDALAPWPDLAREALTTGDAGALDALLVERIRAGHEAILEIGASDVTRRGLGSTAVAALLRGDHLTVAHCGDSRAYLLRDDTLEQLTRDHVLVDGGTRYLAAHVGMAEPLKVDVRRLPLQPGDRLLLCSDGLTDMVPRETFGVALFEAGTPAEAADALVAQALEAGGYDNVTCVVAFLSE